MSTVDGSMGRRLSEKEVDAFEVAVREMVSAPSFVRGMSEVRRVLYGGIEDGLRGVRGRKPDDEMFTREDLHRHSFNDMLVFFEPERLLRLVEAVVRREKNRLDVQEGRRMARDGVSDGRKFDKVGRPVDDGCGIL